MAFRFSFVVFFILVSFVGFGQVDSVRWEIKDTLLIDSLFKNLKNKLIKQDIKIEKDFIEIEKVLAAMPIDTVHQLYAKLYNYKGIHFKNLNKFSKAKEYILKGLNIRKKVLPENHTDIAHSLNNLGVILEFEGKFDKALNYYQGALRMRKKLFGENDIQVAGSINNIAIVYYYKGNYDLAIRYTLESLNLKTKIYGTENLDMALSKNNLGVFYEALSDYKKSITYYQQALKIRASLLGENHVITAGSFHNIGVVHFLMGNHRKALYFLKKAIAIKQKVLPLNHLNLVLTYTSYGQLVMTIGDYDKALGYYKKSLKILTNNFGFEHQRVAGILHSMGIVFSARGEYFKAIEYYDKAIKIWTKIDGEVHPWVAIGIKSKGITYEKKGEYTLAINYYKKNLDILNSIYEEEHSEKAHTYEILGDIFLKENNYEEAFTFYNKALNANLEIYGSISVDVAESYMHLGELSFQKEDYQSVELYFHKALAALNYSDTTSLNEFNGIGTLLDIQVSLGNLYYFLSETNNDSIYLAQALKNYDLFDTVAKYYKKSISTNLQKTNSNNFKVYYEYAITANFNLKRRLPIILSYSEINKSFILLESLNRTSALNFSNIPPELIEKENQLKSDIAYYEKKRFNAFVKGKEDTDTTILEYSSKIFDLNLEQEALIKHFEENYENYYKAKYDLSVVSVEEVQKDLLTENQSLLEYFVGDSSLFLFVINQNDYQVHEVKKDFPLEDWVKTFRNHNSQDSFQVGATRYSQIAHQLYTKLVKPVDSLLKKEVIIIPDGILGYVPFEALLVEPTNKANAYPYHHYWLKDKQISYCYSATLLREMQEKKHKKPATKDFLAFAPFYDGDTTLLTNLFRYGDEEDKKPLEALPESGKEIEGIAKIINPDKKLTGKLYAKEAAKEDIFVAEAGDYRILHLASHAKANDKVGDYSYLAFTEQKDSLENELLYVRDLYNLQLAADMVVLSACETGIGELQRGEGIISLARGFTYAGAKSIITSLWSVADKKTKNLMIDFYKYLKLGYTKDAALRQAKLDFIARAEMKIDAHPFFWSGFIGIGDMESLEYLK